MGERMTQAAARGNSGYRGVSEPLLFRRFAFGNPAVFGAKETNSTGINSELGLPDDSAIKELFAFVAAALRNEETLIRHNRSVHITL